MVMTMNRSDVAAAIYTDTFYPVSPDDSDLWMELFMYADKLDPDMAAILQYLRNSGTRLVKHNKWGYRLVPHVGPEGWESEKQYKQEAEYLKPYRAQLVMMLKKLGGSKGHTNSEISRRHVCGG